MIDEERKQLIFDYREVFDSAAGKRVLSHLQTMFNFDSSFATNISSGNSEYTAMELGKREAFLHIRDWINADPDADVQEVADDL